MQYPKKKSPSFQKKTLSLYLRNKCERQFVLYLYNDKDREKYKMPSRPKKNRRGLGLIGQAGIEWQNEKIDELKEIFGEHIILEGKRSLNPEKPEPQPIELSQILPTIQAYQFIIEGNYKADTTTFRLLTIGLNNLSDCYGNDISISDTRPDIIQVLPPIADKVGPTPELDPNPYELEVLPDGEVSPLQVDDKRLRLRVIDIKLTSEPGAHYFAEVVYYSMTLAAWLRENGYAKQFVVIAAPAVWPGSHEASHLAQKREEWRRKAYIPTGIDLMDALEDEKSDLELAVFDVFAPRLKTFLKEDLPRMLGERWDKLAWHVDHRCKGCEFLGYTWGEQAKKEKNAELRCLPTAEREGNLSRVYGLSRGASVQLCNRNVRNVEALANQNPASNVFEEHQGLQTKRTVFPHRAAALQNGKTSIIPKSGGDALMPQWPNLHIYLFLDYDLSSAITVSMAIRAFWRESMPFSSKIEPQELRWPESKGKSKHGEYEDEVFLVDRREIEQERIEFLKFLRQLKKIINDVRDHDNNDNEAGRRERKTRHSTYQVYLWDEAQRKHLIRLISRHLPHILADSSLSELTDLFPPPELLQKAEEATRQSTITIVKSVVEHTVALDVPHYYRLLDLAEKVVPLGSYKPWTHDLYAEPLSDLIPMERIHEYWTHAGRWLRTQSNIIKATQAKVHAMSIVVRWLEKQLRPLLSRQSAPKITQNPRSVGRIAPVSKLWLGFTRLNAALASLEKHIIRAMPPHEREARLKSARLRKRLEGNEKQRALKQLNETDGIQLIDGAKLFIYQMRPYSKEVNIQCGDFLYALSPELEYGFLDKNAFHLADGTGFEQDKFKQMTAERALLTSSTVKAIDRVNGLIALKVEKAALIQKWEQEGRFDFSKNVILDPIHQDFLTKKIQLTLQGIKHPPSAGKNARIIQALGLRRVPSGKASESPASEVLWNTLELHNQENDNNISSVRQSLEIFLDTEGGMLNNSQWEAWEEALRTKFTLIWGPPGTGKSRTLRAVIVGEALNAKIKKRALRLLVSANTYGALDNVLLELEFELRKLLSSNEYQLFRIQSEYHDAPPKEWEQKYPTLQNFVLNRYAPSPEIQRLRRQLEKPNGIMIVGCPPQQLHNLAILSSKEPKDAIRAWFDFMILDEASQMDVATSTLIFTKRATGGSCVLAGDDLQLPPIHQAEPPEDLEDIVGSLYNYFRRHHKIEPSSLDVNYRSNQPIVNFVRLAGYSPALQSDSPELRLNFLEPITAECPENWPKSLYWTSSWEELLEPQDPTVSFVYDDVLSSQVNEFEADAVAAMIWLLRRRLTNQLKNERQPDGSFRDEPPQVLYDDKQFWEKAVGIVTPHRAQRAKVVNRLREIFPTDSPDQIYGAVDTVERYQGQQRDVIIASFGIGDPDIIEAEDEFLYSLNRFNVMISRARAKVIVLLTQSLLQHLSNDVQVLEESRLLKRYAESYCRDPKIIKLGYVQEGKSPIERDGVLRRRSFSTQ